MDVRFAVTQYLGLETSHSIELQSSNQGQEHTIHHQRKVAKLFHSAANQLLKKQWHHQDQANMRWVMARQIKLQELALEHQQKGQTSEKIYHPDLVNTIKMLTEAKLQIQVLDLAQFT